MHEPPSCPDRTLAARMRRFTRSRKYLAILIVVGAVALGYVLFQQGYNHGAKDGIAWHTNLQAAYAACLSSSQPASPTATSGTGQTPTDLQTACSNEAFTKAGAPPVTGTFTLTLTPPR